jgi:hypothetical protein
MRLCVQHPAGATSSLVAGRRKGTIRAIPHWTGQTRREVMGFGRGFLLWILGIPLPIILLLALFWR